MVYSLIRGVLILEDGYGKPLLLFPVPKGEDQTK